MGSTCGAATGCRASSPLRAPPASTRMTIAPVRRSRQRARRRPKSCAGNPGGGACSAGFERELAVSVEVLGKMRKRGIRVLPGGDYGFPFTPHGTYARDLWIFVKILGFSAMDTLVAATRLGGELMGMPGELGVIKPGALADLLLVDGDPLADITILQDRHALRVIMKDGALHKAPEKGRP